MSNCKANWRVQRPEVSKDAGYSDEEGTYNGKPPYGFIVECIAEDEGLVNVTWDNGNNEIYHVGNDSTYNLYMSKEVGK